MALLLEPLEAKFGANASEKTPGEKLMGLVRRAYEKTNRLLAVIIDEYDAPLLDVLHEEASLPEFHCNRMACIIHKERERSTTNAPFLLFVYCSPCTISSQNAARCGCLCCRWL